MNLCGYRNCHNLASRVYEGYCSEEHMTRALQDAAVSKRMMEEYERRKKLVESEAKRKEEAKK